jgi:5-oxoprolinase (ATP-hydrolysing)
MRRWTIGVDTGGTFTDCVARSDDGIVSRSKVPSSGELRARVVRATGQAITLSGLPHVPQGFWAGCDAAAGASAWIRVTGSDATEPRGTVTLHCGDAWPAGAAPGTVVRLRSALAVPVLAARIALGRTMRESLDDVDLRVGTTIGTNALLEGKAARVVLLTTEGHEDALLIGDQRRRDIFALAPSRRMPLAARRIGVRERMSASGTVIAPLTDVEVARACEAARDPGADAVAIAFVHGAVNASHERMTAHALQSHHPHVVTSADIAATASFLPRAQAAVVEAALRPAIGGFVERLTRDARGARLFLSASSGAAVPAADYMAKDCLLSGPATGVAAAARAAAALGFRRCVTLDVGGTSADASRATDGMPDLARQTTVAEVELASPCVAVESVAAGGGSILWHDGCALRVGPRSAGASPGPASYGSGGPLTLTDAHLLLGRIDADRMPIPMDIAAAERAAEAVLAKANAHLAVPHSRDSLLREFIAIADESMAGAIRAALARAGESPRDHALVAFGGAGGLHACAIAELLEMPAVILPADAGLLCAHGACTTPLQREESRVALVTVGSDGWHARLMSLVSEAHAAAQCALDRWGITPSDADAALTCMVRRQGQEEGLPIALDMRSRSADDLAYALRDAFRAQWRSRFGTLPDDRPLEIEQVIVRAMQRCPSHQPKSSADVTVRHGPVVISRMGSTAWVPAGWQMREHADGSAVLTPAAPMPDPAGSRNGGKKPADGRPTSSQPERAPADPPSTERIASALAAAAAEMGEQLRRTALSVNVRDRLDYSCGILDAAGRLVVNAPHIPVHLGALGACVRAVCAAHAIRPGEVWCVNHPGYGGAHLPDVTAMASVHERDDPEDPGTHLGFVAARAHHAEIGGSRPGSMPPDATRLAEEGVLIPPTRIVSKGEECLGDIDRLLRSGPWPSRSPRENLADLRAQVAALVAGRHAVRAIAERAGVPNLHQAYDRIAEASAAAARDSIRALEHPPIGQAVHHGVQLDDGTALAVRITRHDGGTLDMDFSGTGGCHRGNLNMPASVTRASILYVMRLLVARAPGREGMGLPVAESLLDPVRITLPHGCILSAEVGDDPTRAPAVAVGQTDTAQRLVDMLLSALGLAAESQGTMNNLLFGGSDWGFYETICGGAGGSVAGAGTSAIHTHLTNTRITDIEVLERRHPVRLERFAVREHSGGAGANPGGDGAVRAIRFLAPATGSFLSQHRTTPPRGLVGGLDGAVGTQRIEHPDGTVTPLAGRAAFDAQAGDLLVIETPGGGGFGAPRST